MTTTTLCRITELRETLDRLASALTHARADELLEIEARLAAIVAALPSELGFIEAGQAEAARQELMRARQALMTCRRLGASLQDFVRWSVEWMTTAPRYDAQGHSPISSVAAALNVRG